LAVGVGQAGNEVSGSVHDDGFFRESIAGLARYGGALSGDVSVFLENDANRRLCRERG
jgi:hypothetical protein